MRKFLRPRDLSSEQSRSSAQNIVDLTAALPPDSMVPVFFTAYFTGYDNLLNKLIAALPSPEDERFPVVLSGHVGSGKSQLAGLFLSKQFSQFEGIHWIEAYDSNDIPLQLAACGEAIAKANKNIAWPEKLPDQVDETIKSLRENPNRLIVFSHLNDLEAFHIWKERLGNTSMLVTTSKKDHPEWVTHLEATGLVDEDSIALLRLVCPRLVKSPDEELLKLSESLSNLPLALNLAGCYLRERPRTSVKEYTLEIEKRIASPEQFVKDWVAIEPETRTLPLAAAILQSLRLLTQRGSDQERLGVRIFNTVVYFSPHLPAPAQVLSRIILSDPINQPIFDRSLSWLYSLGLLQPSPHGPVIHSAVAQLAQRAATGASELLTPLTESLTALISSPQFSSIPAWMIFPHLRSVALNAESAGLKLAGALWNRLGALLYKCGDTGLARTYLEHSLSVNANMIGGESVETAAASTAYGRTLSDLGDLPAARAAFEKALAIYERLFGPVYPEVANICSLLGQVLYDMGEYLSAKGYFERAITIHETAFGFGPRHPAIANEADYLGRVMRELEDLPAAKKYFERALEVEEAVNGPHHPNIATRANNLGRVLYKLGELDGARNSFERALEVLKMTQGPENAALATALNNLGLVLQDLGSLEKAGDCFQRALQIDEKLYGAEHPNVARDSNNLGSVYSSLGKLSAARDCFTRALEIDQNIFGSSHPNNAINANNLGRVLYNLGELDGAKEAFERALDVDQTLHGSDHHRVGTDLNNLGTVMYEKGELDIAKAQFERALTIFNKHFEPGHPKIAYARKFLDRLANKMKK